jgi:hypothetical protein
MEVLALDQGSHVQAGIYGEGDVVISPLLTGLKIAVDDIFAGV